MRGARRLNNPFDKKEVQVKIPRVALQPKAHSFDRF